MPAIYHAIAGTLQRLGRTVTAVTPPSTRPTGTGYVAWETLFTAGDDLRSVLAKVRNGDVLTLPTGTFTFANFNDPNGYYDGVRVPTTCGGIWGSGSGTVLQMVAGSSTVGSDTTAVPPSSGTNQCDLLAVDSVPGLVYKSFTLLGTDQGHSYNGLKISNSPGAVVDSLTLIGANPGYSNFPPGETFGINVYRSNNVSIYRTEVDGRNQGGTRVSASPIGWNYATGAYLEDVYAHHAKTSTVTFYQTSGIHTVRLRSEYNGTGSGGLNAHGINHEDVSGTVLHESPSLIIDRVNGNTGLHMTLNQSSTVGYSNDPNVSLTSVSHDAGPTGGCFSVMIQDNYNGSTQTQTSLPTVTKAGVTLTGRDANVSTSSPNPATQFFRYH